VKLGQEKVSSFFDRPGPNLEGIPLTHIFNYENPSSRMTARQRMRSSVKAAIIINRDD
jgi:hypothetical protein